jgi:phosphatidylglycerophosphate synthase
MFSEYKKYYKLLINESYSNDKRFFDRVSGLWIYFLIRPISFVLTPAFVMLRVSANTATFLGFLFGIFALFFGAQGDFLLSAILYNLFLTFDCIDGNIARLTQSTRKGEYFDAVTGDIINFLFIPFIGLGIYINEIDLLVNNNLLVNNIFSISLIVSIFYLLSILASQRYRIIFGAGKDPKRIGAGKNISVIEYIIRNSFGVAFTAPMSIIFAYFHALDLLILYHLFLAPLILIISIFHTGLKNG